MITNQKMRRYLWLLFVHAEIEETDEVKADKIYDELDKLWHDATGEEKLMMEAISKTFYRLEDKE